MCPDMKMERAVEQSVNANFCIELHKSSSESLDTLKQFMVNPHAKEATDIRVQDRSKQCLSAFFDITVINHFEFVPK